MKRILTLVLCAAMTACASSALRPHAPPMSSDMQTEPSKFVVVTVRNDSPPLATRAGATARGYDGSGNYRATSAARTAERELARDYGLQQVSAWPIAALRVDCVVFRVPQNAVAMQMIARLERDPRVDSAESLHEFTTQTEHTADGVYNDPYANLQTALRDLGVPQAQQWSRGAGVRIAIIDTGMDFEHPDLAGQILVRRNFVDADEVAFRLDRHGTAVAGVIAAVADNHVGIVGIAPDARLLALKACWQSAHTAEPAACNSFTLAQALSSAIDLQADIVNLSLAGPEDRLLARLIRRGMQQGIVFVGAAPPPGLHAGFPTDVDGVLSVAAAEDTPGEGGHLLAPGHEVLTLVPGGHWDFASGSSIAAAEVTATVALVLAVRPHTAAPQLLRILTGTSQTLSAHDVEFVSVNACAALAQVLKRDGCDTAASPMASANPHERLSPHTSVAN